MDKVTPPRGRWFQFSLRTMLIVIAVVAAPAAWIAKEQRQSSSEKQLAKQLQEQGFDRVEFSGPFDSWDLHEDGKPQGWWRDLARHILGERIWLVYGPRGRCDFNDLTPLSGLKNLKKLYIGCKQISDLTPLAGLTELQLLSLDYTSVRDLTPLSGLKELQMILLADTEVSDLTPLAALPNLMRVKVFRSPVSREQVEALYRALPKCKLIDHDPFP